jgi:ribosome recycling factor
MNDWQPRMRKTVRLLSEQLATLRWGSVDAAFVKTVKAKVQGQAVPIGTLASVKTEGGRLMVSPFDPENAGAIRRALSSANFGAYAINPRTIAVSAPPVSGEQRQTLQKHVKKMGEDAKVAIRAIRQDARKAIQSSGRGSERRVQEETDAAIEEISRLVTAKTNELSA